MKAMSIKMKTLVAAIAFIGASAANASVLLPNSGQGSGLIFEAWDATSGTSFTQVLGSNTVNSVLTSGVAGTSNGSDQAFTLDTSFATHFGSSSNLQWHIVGLKNLPDSLGANLIMQTLGSTTAPTINRNATNNGSNTSELSTVNTLLGSQTFAYVSSSDNPGYAGRQGWGSSIGGQTPNNAISGFFTGSISASEVYAPTTGVGAFWTFASGGLGGLGQATKTMFQNSLGNASWILQSNGTLTYHVAEATSVVPIPAAAWLFGSGLLGLVGIARRRKNGQ
jgi:hypothetical protein